MSPATAKLKLVLPIYESGELSLKKLAEFMGVNQSQMSKIAGINVRTVSRNNVSSKTSHKLQPIIYSLKMLWELTDGSADDIKAWLNEPLVEWEGEKPIDALLEGDLEAVSQLVKRIYEGDSAGY